MSKSDPKPKQKPVEHIGAPKKDAKPKVWQHVPNKPGEHKKPEWQQVYANEQEVKPKVDKDHVVPRVKEKWHEEHKGLEEHKMNPLDHKNKEEWDKARENQKKLVNGHKMQKSLPDWSEWILEKNAKAQEELDGQWALEKTGDQQSQQQPDALEQHLLNLNKHGESQGVDCYHQVVDGKEAGFSNNWHPSDVAILTDFGDASDADGEPIDHERYQKLMDTHHDAIHKFMNHNGYRAINENDGSGGGLNYGTIQFRKKGLPANHQEGLTTPSWMDQPKSTLKP